MSQITIDSRMILSSGIGTYLQNLVPRIARYFDEQPLTLLGNPDELTQFGWSTSKHIRSVEFRQPIHSIAEQLAYLKLQGSASSLFWSPNYNIPLLRKGKLLVTVHDMLHLVEAAGLRNSHKRLYAGILFAALKRKADRIICVSEFTASEMMRLTSADSKKIQVIHLGVDESWFHVPSGPSPHPRPYVLYVGNVKPHKNLRRLIDAFVNSLQKMDHDLVIVGKKEGFITGDAKVEEKAGKLGGRVRFTGQVKYEVLQQYVSHADIMVFPSLYEGFGLPPLEAMACGCPVIVSRAASLPEVCGDAALYCDPYNTGDIADKMTTLLASPLMQSEYRQRGREHAKKFSWEKCAEETADVMDELLSQ